MKDEFNAVYGDTTSLFTTVKFWAAEFKRSRTSLGNGDRLGRSETATTVDNITKGHQMVLDDRGMNVKTSSKIAFTDLLFLKNFSVKKI
ncbi:hypothetical protein NPIL_648731 [Nephila pilipes]|uniref:Mos1 transposase HTH domain-containing protein n=1 Tax=Nephila pilipes TaxID=299642 RepID=A0A8X6UEG8_NEPPI|nr:hypothetical protein NPIL_648731 [Nephila pilipes]